MRPWSDRPIKDCLEPLQALPAMLLRLEPHPYASLGAPYATGTDPFRLRSGVVARLLKAEKALKRREPGLRLAIFDAWRPIPVQAFMVEHSIAELCRERGVDRREGPALEQVIRDVGRFWAPPSRNPSTPPPHSTGAAVDLTLASLSGTPLEMGGAIDAIGAISEPDHYNGSDDDVGRLWNQRRRLLADVMDSAGFAQHPNEWWHYSHGDQLWAWRSGADIAIYAEAESSSFTS